MTAASAVVEAIVEIAVAVDVEMTVAIVAVGETKVEADVVEAAAVAAANGMTRSVTIAVVLASPTEATMVAVAAEVTVAVASVQMMEVQKLARVAVGKMTEAVVMIGAIVTMAEMPKAILRTKMAEIAVVAVAAEVVAAAGHVSTKARATVVTSKAADKAVIDDQVSELQPASPPLQVSRKKQRRDNQPNLNRESQYMLRCRQQSPIEWNIREPHVEVSWEDGDKKQYQ